MLVIFKRNDGLGFFILIIVAFIMRLAYFVDPPAIAELGDFYTGTSGRFVGLKQFYLSAPRFYIFCSTIFWILFSLYFKFIVVSQKLVKHRDFIPALAFILITSALPPFIVFSIAGLSACFLFGALGIALGTVYNKPARSRYFLVGFFIGLSTVLYWPAGLAFIAILFIVLSIRMFVAQELLALALGTLFPLYLVLTLRYIFTGHFFNIYQLVLGFHLPVSIIYKVATLVLSVFIIVSTFYGLYVSRNNIVENKIQIIKKWNGVVLFFVSTLIVGITATVYPSNQLIFTLIPFSIILSSALINNLKKYNTFTFYLALIVVLALQWVLRYI